MVELRTRKREMRGYEGNHHEKLGLKRISCASKLTMPDTGGKSPDRWWNYTDTRSSQPNQESRTRDFTYPVVFSISFSSSSISLFHVHNSTIIREHKVKSSLSISPCHDHDLTPCKAYTEHCIKRVLHHPKIVCFPFILTIASRPLNVASDSGMPPYKIDRHQPALHESPKVRSPHHIPTVAS